MAIFNLKTYTRASPSPHNDTTYSLTSASLDILTCRRSRRRAIGVIALARHRSRAPLKHAHVRTYAHVIKKSLGLALTLLRARTHVQHTYTHPPP